ncbi:MAG: GFA family protein [Xanthobacteraceae bacterium]
MRIDGACHCGYITIEGEADPEKVQICHCTDCQSGTGSAFRISIPVPGTAFKMTGKPTLYVKTTADSGRPRVQAFCPQCGSPIYSTTPGEGVQSSYTVRVGILRQRDQLTPRRQNWFRSARSWVTRLDAVPKNDKQAPA